MVLVPVCNVCFSTLGLSITVVPGCSTHAIYDGIDFDYFREEDGNNPEGGGGWREQGHGWVIALGAHYLCDM